MPGHRPVRTRYRLPIDPTTITARRLEGGRCRVDFGQARCCDGYREGPALRLCETSRSSQPARQVNAVVMPHDAPMKHDILGEVERTDGHPFDGVATIRYGSRDIKVRIIRDDQPLETALKLAAEVVRRLPELDKLAQRVAVADLREAYNNGWNEYDEAQEDGSVKRVSNPQLSEAEFEAKLSLNAVHVTGDRMIHFFYDDERMFWGHNVVVTSLNGTDFSRAHAEIFG